VAEIKIGKKTYPIPADLSFTYRELGIIKRISGVRSREFQDAIDAGDTDLMVAFAVISARRAGDNLDVEELLDGDIDSIQFIADDVVEGDVVPPAETATVEPSSGGPPAVRPTTVPGSRKSTVAA